MGFLRRTPPVHYQGGAAADQNGAQHEFDLFIHGKTPDLERAFWVHAI
jgi:hypothetical protein